MGWSLWMSIVASAQLAPVTTSAADAQSAWAWLDRFAGQEFTGCYHWKKKECYAPGQKGSLRRASDGSALLLKSVGGTFQFRKTADGGFDVKTPQWEGPLRLTAVSTDELLFTREKTQVRVQWRSGELHLDYLSDGQRAYGYTLASTTAAPSPTLATAGEPARDPSLSPTVTIASAAIAYRHYGFLKPTDANRYLKFPIADAVGRGPYYLSVYSCAPNVDLKVRSATIVQRDRRVGSYYVTTAMAEHPDRKFNFEIDAGSDETVGFPFLVVGQVGLAQVDPSSLVSEGPVCDTVMPTEAELKRRFGDYYAILGKTIVNEKEGWASDFQWLNPGYAIRSGCRTPGEKTGRDWCAQYSFDVKSNRLVKQAMYEPGDPTFLTLPARVRSDVRLTSWREDVAERQASRGSDGGGFGFGKALMGAIAGATGAMNGGGDQNSAIVGALIGGAAGAAGVDSATISQSQQDATADFNASNAELRRIQDEGLADAIKRGQREYDMRQAAERAATTQANEQSATARATADDVAERAAADRLLAEENARREKLRRKADDDKKQVEQAARQAEAERNRPIEFVEGMVICEPRQGSKEWRCHGPLQMNILALDAPQTNAQLGLACGSANGIREASGSGRYRIFGCGFGIHPTARDYPGNIDVPKAMGVFVDDRRVFHCASSKLAYCRNP